MEKICSKCSIAKLISEFVKRGDKYRPYCKLCRAEYSKKYYDNNPEKIKKYYKVQKERNYVNKLKRNRELYKIDSTKKAEYRKKNKLKINEYAKEYRKNNKKLIAINSKNWLKANKNHINAYKRKYNKDRRQKDPLFKLSNNLRRRNALILRKMSVNKSTSTEKLLGAEFILVKQYLEKQFKNGMTWENYGKKGWQVDHIIPLSLAKNKTELEKLFHYTNLQPLWWFDNLAKSNKI